MFLTYWNTDLPPQKRPKNEGTCKYRCLYRFLQINFSNGHTSDKLFQSTTQYECSSYVWSAIWGTFIPLVVWYRFSHNSKVTESELPWLDSTKTQLVHSFLLEITFTWRSTLEMRWILFVQAELVRIRNTSSISDICVKLRFPILKHFFRSTTASSKRYDDCLVRKINLEVAEVEEVPIAWESWLLLTWTKKRKKRTENWDMERFQTVVGSILSQFGDSLS